MINLFHTKDKLLFLQHRLLYLIYCDGFCLPDTSQIHQFPSSHDNFKDLFSYIESENLQDGGGGGLTLYWLWVSVEMFVELWYLTPCIVSTVTSCVKCRRSLLENRGKKKTEIKRSRGESQFMWECFLTINYSSINILNANS